MSSSDQSLIASINNATIQLNRYLPLLIYVTGVIGNLLNTLVLSRRALRSNPCALLFLVSSVAGLIALLSGLTTRLTAGWAIDLSETIGWLCKLRIFVLFIARTMVVGLLVFAAIDRWFLSSFNVHRRHLSTLKNAVRSIVIVTLFSFLLNCPLLYCYEANLIGTPAKCYGKSDACRLYTDLSYTCGTIVAPSLLMILFGLLTIKNIRRVERRVHMRIVPEGTVKSARPSINVNAQRQNKRTDRILFKILLVQVLFLILCTAPYTIYRLYATLTPAASSKSVLQNTFERLLFNLCTDLTYLASAMPFYIYTLCGGRIFRNELLNMVKDFYQKIKCI
jgi:hypothetical protein